MRLVIALGGNAILKRGEEATIAKQFSNTRKAMHSLIPLIKKHSVVITHGNGPQVGNIMIRVEEALGKAYKIPLEVAVAESEGEMGYMIEQCLQNELQSHNIKKPVVSILTQVVVDKADGAFKKPTKPIGPYYSKKHADALKRKGFHFVKIADSYRRVVPSPRPKKIVESDAIKKLLDSTIVIAAGGGGIPVFMAGKSLRGIEAVIDKDLASACLAKNIKADMLIMLTDIRKVALNYKKKNQKNLDKLTINEAKQYLKGGHFPVGSMGPKIEAAIDFLEHGGKKAIITTPGTLAKAMRERDGTVIKK